MDFVPKTITGIQLSEKFFEIHFNASYKANQRIILIVVAIFCILPLLIIPSIFDVKSTFIMLLLSFIFLGIQFSLTSSHIVARFNTVHVRIECFFDSNDRFSKIFTNTLSSLRIIYFSNDSINFENESKKINLFFVKNTKYISFLIFQFTNDVSFQIGPLIGLNHEQSNYLKLVLESFFKNNNYQISFPEKNEI